MNEWRRHAGALKLAEAIHEKCGHPPLIIPILMAADLEAVAASPFVPFGEDVPEGEELTVFGVPIMDGAEAQYEWMARRALRHILALVAAEAPCHRDAEAVRARLRLASHETGLKKAGMELSRPPATKSAAFEAHSAAPKPQENQEGSPGEAAP